MEVGITIKDQYQVVEHIGRGGMADVWSARDQRLNRLVAIKTIAQSLSTDADPIALFEQEAQTIAQMEHPHILPIYDFGDYRNNLYIVMRYVTGGSLEDRLEDDPLPLQETIKIATNIAQALDYAHENNVIHLDLKPPNILMDSGGSPYLADFGLATVLDKGGTARNPGSGTLLYMAPEQLVAEVIDHRADIFSFSVMIWHMLTGTLPFDGMIPLAMKQLQFQEELPPLSEFNENIPYQITDILREGTATEPKDRPSTLTQIVEKLREAADMASIDMDAASWDMGDGFNMMSDMGTELTLDIEDVGLLEAADIYIRAKHVWSGGNGRFLLGVSHFMMMCDYYMEAEVHHLDLDDAGRQMILRGALEYDYQVDYWWDEVDDEARRWVCLHTIRSENAPARIRALYRLETLPDDSQNPVIPKLVANALAIETNTGAKLAALAVLGTRSKLVKPSQSYNIKTEFRGQLLNTTTRLGIEVQQPDLWQEPVYSPEIDLLIAEEALKEDEHDDVTERAARTIGLIHSLTALRAIAKAQRQNAPHALRALALIRDEAPYLPDVVSPQARLYAWVANTIRRITDESMQLVLRFIFALLGGAIGFGQHVYITYRSQALFVPQRWGNTLAVGLLMGLFIAILVMFTDALISRLRGFWPNWLRLVSSIGFGLLLGTLTWTGFTWLYLNQPPVWDLMRMGGLGLAFGLIASTVFNLKSWKAMILSSVVIFLSIFAAYYNNCTQLFICFADNNFNMVEGVSSFSIAPVAFIGALFGILFGLLIPQPKPVKDAPPTPPFALTKFGGLVIFLLAGLGVTALAYSLILGQAQVTWDNIIGLFAIPTLVSAVAFVVLDLRQRVLYAILSIVGFGVMMVLVQNTLTSIEPLIAPQTGADYIDALFSYDLYWQVFTVGFPVALIISFGAFARGIFRDLRQFIGEPIEVKERNAWLTGILLYVMTISALMTLFAPFSAHESIPWAVAWTLIGAGTFTCAYATWQWKRWGAIGLLIFGAIFIIGGFIADYRTLVYLAGIYTSLFTTQSLVTWGTWAIVTGVLTIGVMRRKLWGAFGLIAMIVLWFIISLFLNTLGDSLTGLAILHLPLVAYALRHDWHLFESGKRKAKAKHDDATPTDEPAHPPLSVPVPDTNLDTDDLIPAQTPMADTELVTEVDSDNLALDPDEMETELDPQRALSARLKGDGDDVDIPDLPTELSPTMPESKSDADETETSKPKLKIDTSLVKKDKQGDDKPDNKSERKGLKIDTSLMKSKDKQVDKLDSKSERKGLKIDTSLMKSKDKQVDKPDSKSERKGLKIDTSLMKSKDKQDEKPDSKSKRKGLKIDTSLMKSKDKQDDKQTNTTDEDGEIPESTLDDTLPSRETTKLSTAEIKKQIAEEARRMKEEAEAKAETEKQKPKFTLDTSRIKKNKDDDDDTKDE